MGKSLEAREFLLGVLLVVTSPAMAQPPAVPSPAAASGTTVRGRVSDSQSRGPVGQAEVVVVRTGLRAFTDDDGRFVLERVPAGACTLSVMRIGYAPLRRELTITEGVETTLDLQLVRSAVPLAEITVTPGSFSFMGQGTGTRQTMSREDVQAVPQIGDDIFRAVNRLPGLASNDYAAHFGIRGGRHDETLILLDGLELYEPYHLKDFNEGAVSIIDAETIDGVQLMTGGFSARYGNRRSGVFDITSRTPDQGRTYLDVGVSMMNTHATGSGSFAGDRGWWLGFGRIGYMGPMFAIIGEGDLPKPYYEDVFGKVSYKLSTHHELSLEVQHAGDRYVYDIAATTGFLDTINTREHANNHYGNSYAWTTLKSTLGPRTTVRTMLSGGLITRSRDGYEQDVLKTTPFYSVVNDRTYKTFGAAQDWTHGFSDRDIVSLGVDFRQQHNDDQYQSTVYQDPDDPEPPSPGEFPILASSHFVKGGSLLAAYLSNRWRVASPLVLETGVRYDRATWTGDHDWSPRVSAAMNLGRSMTARAGWGYYRQMQGIDDVATLNNATTYYHSELSEQVTAGLERTGAKGSLLRLEGYWKRGTRLRPVFRNWKGAIDAFPEPNEDRIQVFPDHNGSKGGEIYFDRPVSEHLTLRASYSFSVADEDVVKMLNVNSSDTLSYDFSHSNPQDQRNAANADVTWRDGPWSFNGSLGYHSGWPSTLEGFVPVTNDLGQPDVAIRPAKIYGARLPDYVRLDLRVTRKWRDFGFSLELINATNHPNVFGYDYVKTKDDNGKVVLEQNLETWFSIFPSLGVTWSKSF